MEGPRHPRRATTAATFYAYGGHFGDEPNDANFVADGIVGPEGDPHPALIEHKWLGRPVRVTASDADLRKGRVRVHNAQWFSDLSGLRARYEVTVDGLVVDEGDVDVPAVAPQSSALVDVTFARPTLAPGQESFLTLRFRLANRQAWASRGFEVAWDQLALRSRPPAAVPGPGPPRKRGTQPGTPAAARSS